jgi:preprotein translocase subunit SecE
VARDRHRAKQRKARRAAQNLGPTPSEPHRANVPGELEHASGEVDEFDAAIVAGAEGVPVEVDDDLRERDEDLRDRDVQAGAPTPASLEADAEPDFDEDDDEAEDGEDAAAGRGRRAAPAARAAAGAPASRGGGLMAFLRACWAELQRVQWPDRRQVAQATAVVLGFVIVAGVYLGVADRVAQEVVNFII